MKGVPDELRGGSIVIDGDENTEKRANEFYEDQIKPQVTEVIDAVDEESDNDKMKRPKMNPTTTTKHWNQLLCKSFLRSHGPTLC